MGFVESGESFGDMQSADANAEAAATTAPKEDAQTIAQADDEIADESSKPENQSSDEIPNQAHQVANAADQPASRTPENPTAAKTEATVAAPAESKPTTAATASVGKNGTNAVADGREPFEFEKCTINLNLTLLLMESGKNTRKVIVGAVSHNLPPEIEFLEITQGGNLTQIGEVVREKLERFKQTLPVKYIEQLRTSKAKSVKKTAPTKATTAVAAPTQSANNQANTTKESGEQKAQETKREETEKPKSEAATEKNDAAASTSPMPTVNQSGAGNSIQGSLF